MVHFEALLTSDAFLVPVGRLTPQLKALTLTLGSVTVGKSPAYIVVDESS